MESLPVPGRRDRKFSLGHDVFPSGATKTQSKEKLMKLIEANEVGATEMMVTPFGLRKLVYCDYTASGRQLKFIEEFIQERVMPLYANTHSEASITGTQTGSFVQEAHTSARSMVNAGEDDAVLFVGNGATGAIHKLVDSLRLNEFDGVPEEDRPVVFVSQFEHHSNVLPWRNAPVTTVVIPDTKFGHFSLGELQIQLKKYSHRPLLIGSFTACNNVTAVRQPVERMAAMMHRAGGLVFFDFANAAPHIRVNMNPMGAGDDAGWSWMDAVFISPHKMVGGPGTPGLLVCKKRLFRSATPSCGGGGGSVFFVDREKEYFLENTEYRETSGTPNVVGIVRAGLTFQLRHALSPAVIEAREDEIHLKVTKRLSGISNLSLVGPPTKKLPLLSMLVKFPHSELMLHHGFVTVLLNDLFGIQTRGGCLCNGPGALNLLGLDQTTAGKLMHVLKLSHNSVDGLLLRERDRVGRGTELMRPGVTRLNIPFYFSDEVVDYVLEAVALVAEHGWRLLPQYTFNADTGLWTHVLAVHKKTKSWLAHLNFNAGDEVVFRSPLLSPAPIEPSLIPVVLRDSLAAAKITLLAADVTTAASPMNRGGGQTKALGREAMTRIGDAASIHDEAQDLRWFVLPSEAQNCLESLPKMADGSFPSVPAAAVPDSAREQVSPLRGSMYLEAASGSAEEQALLQAPEDGSGDGGQTLDYNRSWCPVQVSSQHRRFTAPITSLLTGNAVGAHDNRIAGAFNAQKISEASLATASAAVVFDEHKVVEAEAEAGMEIEDVEGEAEGAGQQSASKRLPAPTPTTVPGGAAPAVAMANAIAGNGGKAPEGLAVAPLTGQNQTANQLKKQGKFKYKKGHVWQTPPRKGVQGPMRAAVSRFNMIQDGDKILVCISGGKDSLSLLHCIRNYQFVAKAKGVNFEFGAITVDPQTPEFDPSSMKVYMKALGVPYFYESQPILEQARAMENVTSICSFCSRMKRGIIYTTARREGYNVLAMGQHLDDLAESFLMSTFYNGLLRTMKANYTVSEGDLRVIRPFVFTRERDLAEFAADSKLPVIAESCPGCFSAPQERARLKRLLAQQENLFPSIYNSLKSAMFPLMAIGGVNQESHSAREIKDKYKSVNGNKRTGGEFDEDSE